jgi:hypothetical protein
MKKHLALVLLFAIAGSAHAVDIFGEKKEAITLLFKQCYYCKMENSRIVINQGKMVEFSLHAKPFLEAIGKIDGDKCPEKVKLAWFDYKKSVESQLRLHAGNALRARTGTAQVGALFLAHIAATEETQEQWDKLERAALEEGVDVEKIKYD